MSETLIELLRREGEDVVREFKKASITGEGTPQEIADFREGYFRNFLERYFPFPHKVTKGAIIDSFGNRSASVDCIICNPIHPYTLDRTGKFSIIFADGVDFAIEIKPNLQINSELEIALKQAQTVKKLKRVEGGILNIGVINDAGEFAKTVPSIIFSLKAKSNIDDTVQEIADYYMKTKTPIEEQFDLIIFNGLGILVNQKYPGQYRNYGLEPEYGYFLEEWGDLTIAGFLLYLDLMPHASVKMSEGILTRYLKNTGIGSTVKLYPTYKIWAYQTKRV